MKLTSQLRKYAKAKSMAALKANFWRTLGVYAMYYLLLAAVGVLGVLLFLGILLGAVYSMLPQMTVLPSSSEAIAMAMVGPIVAAYALVIVLVVLAAGPLTLLVTNIRSAPAIRRYFLARSTCSGAAISHLVTTPTAGLAN